MMIGQITVLVPSCSVLDLAGPAWNQIDNRLRTGGPWWIPALPSRSFLDSNTNNNNNNNNSGQQTTTLIRVALDTIAIMVCRSCAFGSVQPY